VPACPQGPGPQGHGEASTSTRAPSAAGPDPRSESGQRNESPF
jgi:hypothetical protein